MDIIIQKFGGTSVATHEARSCVVDKIIEALNNGEMPVVVVSAMGRKGDPFATDTLLDFVKEEAGTLQAREYDLLLSCGEIISAVTLTTLLQNKNYQAVALTGGQAGIITDNRHKCADLLYGKCDQIKDYIQRGIIPIVAGFQGVTVEGEVTTLGRGGSDTSAAMLGGLLGAKRIDVFTDVDGMMTADPRICNKATIIEEVSYNEVFQMADCGAKVIHPRAVEYAMRSHIPIYIKNTFTGAKGTCITQHVKKSTALHQEKIITGIAHKGNRIQVKVYQALAENDDLLEQIAKEGISIDLINIFPDHKVFTIDGEVKDQLELLLKQQTFNYELKEKCCKITAIGERMTGVPGVMAKIINGLNRSGIKVLQTADSLTTIGCLIEEKHISQAVEVLHEVFGLSK